MLLGKRPDGYLCLHNLIPAHELPRILGVRPQRTIGVECSCECSRAVGLIQGPSRLLVVTSISSGKSACWNVNCVPQREQNDRTPFSVESYRLGSPLMIWKSDERALNQVTRAHRSSGDRLSSGSSSPGMACHGPRIGSLRKSIHL